MPKRKAPQQKWTQHEIKKMHDYIITNSDDLTSNLYINIVAGYMRFRKPRRFFINLGNLINRTSILCKSKFQKIEKTIYTDYLKIPQEIYEVFKWIRNKKSHNVNYDFKKVNASSKNHQNKQFDDQSKIYFKLILGLQNIRFSIIKKLQKNEIDLSNDYKGPNTHH